YFDQKRSELNPKFTLKKVLSPSGNDYIEVMGKERHICGYLKDFMFDPARIEDRVCNLSGGQKNRLMLAKILASPKSCLILDEPTNDLDMETLDMLEEIISQYKGTLIVVSHDRDFLDQTVTQIIAFEGDTKIDHCVGGYSDYLAQKQKEAKPKKEKKGKPKKSAPMIEKVTEEPKAKKEIKLSYKLEYELTELPKKIEKLTTEIDAHNTQLRDPDFYQKDPAEFHKVTKALSDAETKRDRYETRWLELSEMKPA
ncbi:MAG: ATP-binding cassette domain-containing protein, partial [Alphaproteobacteria bacterium]|nr:ATP-binding cassette domain-containing protein [Alphaproteobacteria bacterium]